jgi:DNA-binding transcriptional LysR family regulator
LWTHKSLRIVRSALVGPELRQLRYFLALADAASFSRAAEGLHLTQQALSAAMKQLELRVGAELLVRRPTGVELTPAGATLREHARRTVAAADALAAAMQAHRDGREGVLRVGLLMDGAGPLTAPILLAFRATRPAVALTVRALDPAHGLAPLVDGAVDVAILHGPYPEDERIQREPLFEEPRVVAVAARGELADAPRLGAADLVERPVGGRHPAMPSAYEGFFTLVPERAGEQPERVGPPASSFAEVLWNVGLRDLVLTLPAHFDGSYAAERFGLRYVPAPDLEPVAFFLAWPRGGRDVRVDAFARVARQVVRERIGLIPGARAVAARDGEAGAA